MTEYLFRDKRHFVLLGLTRKTDNYGVLTLLTSAVQILQRAGVRREILLLDYGRSPASWLDRIDGYSHPVRLLNLRFSWKMFLRNNVIRVLLKLFLLRVVRGTRMWNRIIDMEPILRWLPGATFLSFAGGDSFSDIYGARRLLSCLSSTTGGRFGWGEPVNDAAEFWSVYLTPA